MKEIVIIFDMNGTVVDSDEAHWKAYQQVLREHGIDFTFEEFTREWTSQGKKLDDALRKHGREDLIPQAKAIKAKKDEIFRATMNERLRLMPKIREVLEYLKGKVRLALDSTSVQEDVERILRQFDLTGFFDVITSGDMEWDEAKYGKKSKSSRFQFIADTLGIPPGRCIVVGDAEKDVKAAKEKGMKVVSIPTRYTKDNDFSDSDRIITNAGEVSIELINEIQRNK
jgi:beta-phosphoglucomutase-like phosphatase (HAD superfamily)